MDSKTSCERLEEFLDGRMGEAEQEEFRAHLLACADCGAAAEILPHEADRTAPEPPPDLAAAILDRTTGPTCANARDRLSAWSDRSLQAVESELVRLHLDDCADCAALARVLARMSVDLPALAELDPGGRFVDDVLGATAAGRRRWDGWAARMAAGWENLVRRPRFAMEGAYVATIMFVLIFGIPTVPFAGISRQVRGMVDGGTGSAIGQPMAELQNRVSTGVDELKGRWQELELKADTASRNVREDLARRKTGSWEKIDEFIGTIRDRLASEQVNEPADPDTGGRTGEQGEENDERN
jgi:hypothetical protein